MSISEHQPAGNSKPTQNYQKNTSKSNHQIPVWWYHTLRSKKDRPDYPAILILAELYYLRDFFGIDEYSYGYDYLQRRLTLGRDAMKNALLRLERAKIVKRSWRHVRSQNRTFANVLHITLNPSVLERLKIEFDKRGGLFARNVSAKFRSAREDAQILGMLDNTEQMRGADLAGIVDSLEGIRKEGGDLAATELQHQQESDPNHDKDSDDDDSDSGSGGYMSDNILKNRDIHGLFSYGDALHDLAKRGGSLKASCLRGASSIKFLLTQIGACLRIYQQDRLTGINNSLLVQMRGVLNLLSKKRGVVMG